MPRNTRKVKPTPKFPKSPKLVSFNFHSHALNAIVEQCGDKLLPWQTDDVPDCRNALQFFDGPARVFEKYMSLFPDKYEKYMAMSFSKLRALVPRFPSSTCKQLVIGAGEDIVLYIAINDKYVAASKPPPFTLYMPGTWTHDNNRLFMQCGVRHLLNACTANQHYLRILLPKDLSRLLNADGEPRVSFLEMMTISKYVDEMHLRAFLLKTPARQFDYDIVFI